MPWLINPDTLTEEMLDELPPDQPTYIPDALYESWKAEQTRDQQRDQAIVDATVKALGERGLLKAPEAPVQRVEIVSSPPRVTRRKVTRDQTGRITETIDVEEDVA